MPEGVESPRPPISGEKDIPMGLAPESKKEMRPIKENIERENAFQIGASRSEDEIC